MCSLLANTNFYLNVIFFVFCFCHSSPFTLLCQTRAEQSFAKTNQAIFIYLNWTCLSFSFALRCHFTVIAIEEFFSPKIDKMSRKIITINIKLFLHSKFIWWIRIASNHLMSNNDFDLRFFIAHLTFYGTSPFRGAYRLIISVLGDGWL